MPDVAAKTYSVRGDTYFAREETETAKPTSFWSAEAKASFPWVSAQCPQHGTASALGCVSQTPSFIYLRPPGFKDYSSGSMW